MSIIFNYLFTPVGTEFRTRVPVRIWNGQLLPNGLTLTATDLNGVDLGQWEGKNLDVTVHEGVYIINGLAGQL